ncbi:MAG: site-2 protease family protein [Patescibacteria group bacterium]|nr:site-2 protease family protein [Patescibacteria group bacterium]
MYFIFYFLVLIFSVILHEIAHGYVAKALGDPTAKLAGRLTLNPLPHIDPVGSVMLPFLMWMAQGFSPTPILIGYAKPVPINLYNLQGKYAEALTAFAGPGANILIALIFGLAVRALIPAGAVQIPPLAGAFATIALLNMLLALFNLIPIPPMDGSRVLAGILPGALGRGYERFRHAFERLGVLTCTLIILLVFYLFAPYFYSVLGYVINILTGL